MTNDSSRSLAYPEVVVELLDARGNVTYRIGAPVAPAHLAPGEEGSYVVPLPEGADRTEIRVSPGPLPVQDDDPIDVTLRQLLRAIKDYRSEHEHGNGYVFDISELYAALSAEFGGEDRDRDGVEDVEQVFRSHGFFADLDGSRSWRAGEAPGLTSHPVFEGFPAALPRPDLPAAPEATVTIDSGGVATHAVVYLTFAPPDTSRSYGYVTAIVDGQIVLAPPPPGYDAELTILLLADGYTPGWWRSSTTKSCGATGSRPPANPSSRSSRRSTPTTAAQTTTSCSRPPFRAPAPPGRSRPSGPGS